jgi:hypothetical protein
LTSPALPASQEKHCYLDLSIENFVLVNQLRAADRLAYPKFLWIDDVVPEPDRDAGTAGCGCL